MKLTLASKRCGCRTCGQFFRSLRAFDAHRTGPWTARRCMTAAEMTEAGLELHRLGYWRFLSSGNPWVAGAAQKQPIADTLHG